MPYPQNHKCIEWYKTRCIVCGVPFGMRIHQLFADRERLQAAIAGLCNYYIANPYTKSEFIATVTAGNDKEAEAYKLFLAARALLPNVVKK